MPQDLLKKPPLSSQAPTDEQKKAYEKYAQQGTGLSSFQKRARKAFEGGVGLFKGATGLGDFNPGVPTAEDKGNALGQILMSGLPFAQISKKLHGVVKPVYHGARKAHETLDPKYYDKSDVLGWMTHFAESPEYANEYAGLPSWTGKANYAMKGTSHRPVMRAAVPINRNTLDLINPNPDDLSAALSALSPSRRDMRVKDYKEIRKNMIAGDYDRGGRETQNRGARIAQESLAGDILYDFNQPETFKRSQFDAIRYNDSSHPSWAIPAETLNRTVTPGGLPINKDLVMDPLGKKSPSFIFGPSGIEDVRVKEIPERNETLGRLKKVTKHDQDLDSMFSQGNTKEDQLNYQMSVLMGNKKPLPTFYGTVEDLDKLYKSGNISKPEYDEIYAQGLNSNADIMMEEANKAKAYMSPSQNFDNITVTDAFGDTWPLEKVSIQLGMEPDENTLQWIKNNTDFKINYPK